MNRTELFIFRNNKEKYIKCLMNDIRLQYEKTKPEDREWTDMLSFDSTKKMDELIGWGSTYYNLMIITGSHPPPIKLGTRHE